MGFNRAEVKTGARFTRTEPLAEVANEYPNGLIGLTAIARVIDARGAVLYDFPMQSISPNQTEITFVCPGANTEGWPVGEYASMDIMFHNGSGTGRVLTPTVSIEILRGITPLNTDVFPQGSFGQSFGDSFSKKTT